MESVSLLYKGKEELRGKLDLYGLNSEEVYFIRVYTSVCTEQEAVCAAKELKELFPNSVLIGSSGSGVICQGKQYENETLVLIEKYEHTAVRVGTYSFHGKSAEEMAEEIAADIDHEEVPLMHILCGNHYYDIHNFIEEFRKLNSTTRLVGGVVGDVLSKNITGYVFTEDGVIGDGIVTAALCNPKLHVFTGVNISHEQISPVYTLTDCEGSLVKEIEHEASVEWCETQFGMEELHEYNDWEVIADNDFLVRFPIILEGHNGAGRFVKYDTAAQNMSLYFSRLKKGTQFRIGYTSPTKCVKECYDICNAISVQPVESLFCYSCLFRKLYLGNCAEWELRPFSRFNICGVFMMGEIGNIHGQNEFFNGCCSFVGTAEQESCVRPDLKVFEDLYQIKDENDELLNVVLKKFSRDISDQNQELLERLLSQQEKARQQLYVDANLGLCNTIKFSEDNQVRNFDKMCMVQIENALLLIAHSGRKRYYEMVRSIIAQARSFARNMECRDQYSYYVFNENTLFMVADEAIAESEFMEFVRKMYERFQLVKLEDNEEVFINRFVVSFRQPDLLESSLNTLQMSKNLQTHFLICNTDLSANTAQMDERCMLQILTRVIENDGVIPYFQGIYDNVEHRINKYEALMRIKDTDGTIYAPASFMDIAKKYHLYAALSRRMIEQVFEVFSGSNQCVSINLSALDINFPDMQEWILGKLDQIGEADNFIFEILEDEEFQDMTLLREFICKVRKYGVRIAIDDFGSGYSNFMEIARIEPDFLKVDGSIVRNVVRDRLNHKVLENIVFLGKQLEANVVAEFVENEQIQKKIEDFGIRFSQGFYFSKPSPLSDVHHSKQ